RGAGRAGGRAWGGERAAGAEENAPGRSGFGVDQVGLDAPPPAGDEAVVVAEEVLFARGGGEERVGEDAHAPAADEAVVPAVVVVEAEGKHLGLSDAGVEHVQSLLLDLGLDAAAAERADLPAVGDDEHCGAGLLRPPAA